MTESSMNNSLIDRLASELGVAKSEVLVARLTEVAEKPDTVQVVQDLLDELEEASAKAARAAKEALPELDRRAGLSLIIPWLDLGVAVAESSGATALKYFKDTPLILGLIEPADSRASVLVVGLEIADQDANVALEYLRAAPQIVSVVPHSDLGLWLTIGIEVTKVDVVVGLEYIRQIPTLAPVLPIGEVRSWLSFGMKLIEPNTLGKPDYIAVMEFLRRSPAILGEIEQPAVRSKVLSLGTVLSDHSPESGAVWLGESPRLLRALPSAEWQIKVLQYGSLLAETDSETTLSYLRRCPEIIGVIGAVPDAFVRFENWWKAGVEVLAYSQEGARAYFAMESQKSLSSVEEAMSGVSLRQVARKLKLFVQGLCGMDITIRAIPDSLTTSTTRATVSADGRTISLPALLRRYSSVEANERLYLVMAAHEAGHLEFGTYGLTLDSLADLVETVRQRYGRSMQEPETLAALFRLYPHPQLVQDLWMVLEDARVESLLQAEYPGLRRELAQLATEVIIPRDPAYGLTVRELIIDCLLRLSTGESEDSAVPHAVKGEVGILWNMCQPLLKPTAKAEDTVRLVHDLYVRMEELLPPLGEVRNSDQGDQEFQERGTAWTGSVQSGDTYNPIRNWVHRGAMNPEWIKQNQDPADQFDEQQMEVVETTASVTEGSPERADTAQGVEHGEQESMNETELGGGRSLPPVVEEFLLHGSGQESIPPKTADGKRTVRYPEWDHTIQDYRMNWCRVVERLAESGSDECVDATLITHRSAIKSIRRFFECLRPPAFRRIASQADGEDLDIDAVVRRAAEVQAGFESTDRIYVRREKKERNVAVAFLVDVSGSTSRRLESGRRVIEIEKESLVLLCESLDALGDQYGLYAYSGEGRASVDFLTVKDFDDCLGASTARRLGGLGPRRQNRDGAAIRHAMGKLLEREAQTRILILLSDGRPLDGEYKDDYALEDTKMALREARHRGIDAFCITIDREADSYMRRMYGDVRYTVIDRVESLPTRVPRIYQRLTA